MCKTRAPTKLALFPFVPLVLEAPITTISGSVRDATLQYTSLAAGSKTKTILTTFVVIWG